MHDYEAMFICYLLWTFQTFNLVLSTLDGSFVANRAAPSTPALFLSSSTREFKNKLIFMLFILKLSSPVATSLD